MMSSSRTPPILHDMLHAFDGLNVRSRGKRGCGQGQIGSTIRGFATLCLTLMTQRQERIVQIEGGAGHEFGGHLMAHIHCRGQEETLPWAEGAQALKDVIAAVPQGIPVILDAKRGDIGTTAVAYADAAKEVGAHCMTLNAYMGVDTVQPFITDPSKGAFILCKTSNESSNELQTLPVGTSGKVLFEEVARLCESWNVANNVGIVVGATDTDALLRARAAAPGLWILAPGVGVQGGDLEETCDAALDSAGLGLILPISRSISRAADPGAMAAEFRDRINAARQRCLTKRNAAAGGKAQALAASASILPYQREFIEFALSQGVLKFSNLEANRELFALKSGRMSPYFFNAGEFSSGLALARLGQVYAAAIVNARPALEFDVIFGPAYKGISLGAAVALTLADRFGIDVGFAYNRKEAKAHGEGGNIVGAELEGKRVLIVDDVITAGTAIREAMGLLEAKKAVPVGVVVALDRQERTGAIPEQGQDASTVELDPTSAVQQVEEAFGVPVVSVIGFNHLTAYIAGQGNDGGVNAEAFEALMAYRAQYGIDVKGS